MRPNLALRAIGVEASELAEVTAEQAFKDADLNHDGRLSFEEFQRWYNNGNEPVYESESSDDSLSDEERIRSSRK